MMTRCATLIFLLLMLPSGCSDFEHEYVPDDDSSSSGDDDHAADDDASDDDTAMPDDDTGGGIPEISVMPPAITFVDIVDDQVTGDGIRITNTGTADLFVSGIAFLQTVDGLANATWSGTITPQSDHPIEDVVVADCHTTGTMENDLQITSNDPYSSHVEVHVTVECMDAAQ